MWVWKRPSVQALLSLVATSLYYKMVRDQTSGIRSNQESNNKRHRRPPFSLKNRSGELVMSNFLKMVTGSVYDKLDLRPILFWILKIKNQEYF